MVTSVSSRVRRRVSGGLLRVKRLWFRIISRFYGCLWRLTHLRWTLSMVWFAYIYFTWLPKVAFIVVLLTNAVAIFFWTRFSKQAGRAKSNLEEKYL